MDFCQLRLTCKDKTEADRIANALLVKRLVACVRRMPVVSDYRWQGQVEHEDEIMLVMESRLDLFEKVEAEITKHHSYDTFVLEATPVSRLSKKASSWLESEIK